MTVDSLTFTKPRQFFSEINCLTAKNAINTDNNLHVQVQHYFSKLLSVLEKINIGFEISKQWKAFKKFYIFINIKLTCILINMGSVQRENTVSKSRDFRGLSIKLKNQWNVLCVNSYETISVVFQRISDFTVDTDKVLSMGYRQHFLKSYPMISNQSFQSNKCSCLIIYWDRLFSSLVICHMIDRGSEQVFMAGTTPLGWCSIPHCFYSTAIQYMLLWFPIALCYTFKKCPNFQAITQYLQNLLAFEKQIFEFMNIILPQQMLIPLLFVQILLPELMLLFLAVPDICS